MGEGLIVRRGGSGKPEGLYAWNKLSAKGGEFIGFVVSNNASEYPNGGTQDGYWYELVIDGLDLSLIGCTKCAVDKFTVTANTYSQDIAHSLGEKPKLAIITASKKVNAAGSNQIAVYRALYSCLDGVEKGGIIASGLSNYGEDWLFTYGNKQGSYFDAKASHLQWWGSSNNMYAYFMAGVEYTVFTAA